MDMVSDGAILQSGGIGVRFADITDGLSSTLLVGEKHVPLHHFGEGQLDNSGYNGDYYLSHARPAGVDFPLAQTDTEMRPLFGSYHTSVVQFGFCDGSVRGLPRSIPPNILQLLASRNDGEAIPGGY
jgi:hypothetical protein